jgi:hypothetical protein
VHDAVLQPYDFAIGQSHLPFALELPHQRSRGDAVGGKAGGIEPHGKPLLHPVAEAGHAVLERGAVEQQLRRLHYASGEALRQLPELQREGKLGVDAP